MVSPVVCHPKFVLANRISLAKHTEYDEKWVEALVKQQPSILGLGENVQFVSSQIKNSNGGRLDLVLKDEEVIYSVELMLGQLDESHIIRSLDYWLRNQTRQNFLNYEHIAVLVAEGVLSGRFTEVVRYLSSKTNLVVIELAALQVQEYVTLHCTTIFDGSAAVEDDVEQESGGSLSDWPSDTLALVRNILDLVKPTINETIEPNPRKDQIGIRVGNKVQNFIVFTPKADFVRVAVYVNDPEQWSTRLQHAGIKVLSSQQGSRVRFRLTQESFDRNRDLMKEICIDSGKAWFE